MHKESPTRGYGSLEKFLSSERCKQANRLILPAQREGRILDIGCGNTPYFLQHSEFREKFGIDQELRAKRTGGISLITHDIENDPLPFKDGYFTVVTMLAVLEHIEPEKLRSILKEVRRVLRPGGHFVATTPAPWSDLPLKIMARLNMVSKIELEEHKDLYDFTKITKLLRKAGFTHIKHGYFELFMNLWFLAVK